MPGKSCSHSPIGDLFVTVMNVTAGAYVELWDVNLPVPLDSGYVPLNGSDRSTMVFSEFHPVKRKSKSVHQTMALWQESAQ